MRTFFRPAAALPRAEAGPMAQMSGDAGKQMAGDPKWTRAVLAKPLRLFAAWPRWRQHPSIDR
jgi:hypothetical protein